MALDLRNVIAGMKMASELERIADYAANIARHVSDLDHQLDIDRHYGCLRDGRCAKSHRDLAGIAMIKSTLSI